MYHPWRWVSDEIIAVTYLVIPIELAASAVYRNVTMRRRWTDPATLLLLLFAAFIFACGVGHQLDSWFISEEECSAWTPLKTNWNWVTAALSALTLAFLIPGCPRYVAWLYRPVDAAHLYDTIEELQHTVETLQATICDLQQSNTSE